MRDALTDLALDAGRTLLKFTEGREDWSEWLDVRDSLAATIKFIEPRLQDFMLGNIQDFDARVESRFPGLLKQRKKDLAHYEQAQQRDTD